MPRERIPEHLREPDPRRGEEEPGGGSHTDPGGRLDPGGSGSEPVARTIPISNPVVDLHALPTDAMSLREETKTRETDWEAKKAQFTGAGKTQQENEFARQTLKARNFGSNLADFLYDSISLARDRLVRIAASGDPDLRTENEQEVKEFEALVGFNDSASTFSKKDGLAPKLSEWNQLRQTFPCDWARMRNLQSSIHFQIKTSIERYEAAYAERRMSDYEASIHGVVERLVAIGFELAVQASELVNRRMVLLAEPSQVVAYEVEVNTSAKRYAEQLDKKLSDTKDTLSTFWSDNANRQLPARGIDPLADGLKRWETEFTRDTIDFDALNTATNALAAEVSRLAKKDGEFAKQPERDRTLDLLSAVADDVVDRLNDRRIILNADIDHALEFTSAFKKLKQSRPVTAAEKLVRDGAVTADKPSNFWSERRDAALDDKRFADNEEALAAFKTLRVRFNENLGKQLDTFFGEAGRSHPDPAALRDALFDVKFTLRRYKFGITDTLKAPSLVPVRNDLINTIDALQISVAEALRGAAADADPLG